MGDKFLCCLPLRLAVLVVSFCQFVVSILASCFLWWALYYHRTADEINMKQKINTIFFAVTCATAAVMSCVGFLGTLAKNRRHMSRFSSILNFVPALQIIVGTVYLALFFTDKSEFINFCTTSSKGQGLLDNCNREAIAFMAVVITSVVIPPLTQLYTCYIVAAYAEKLAHTPLIRLHSRRTQDFVVSG